MDQSIWSLVVHWRLNNALDEARLLTNAYITRPNSCCGSHIHHVTLGQEDKCSKTYITSPTFVVRLICASGSMQHPRDGKECVPSNSKVWCTASYAYLYLVHASYVILNMNCTLLCQNRTSCAIQLWDMGALPDHLSEDLWVPCTMHRMNLWYRWPHTVVHERISGDTL